MKIEFKVGRTNIVEVHELLLAEAKLRAQSEHRYAFRELAIVHEPQDCFYINYPGALNFVKDIEKFAAYLYEHNVPLVIKPRGGNILWHGKGQVLLEPLVDVEKRKINNSGTYTTCLAKAMVATLRAYGINAIEAPCRGRAKGTWVDVNGTLKKIGFLGAKLDRGFALHGCALNVDTDMEPFSLIWPCGIVGAQATSMKEVLGTAPPLHDVAQELVQNFLNLLEGASQRK